MTTFIYILLVMSWLATSDQKGGIFIAFLIAIFCDYMTITIYNIISL